jgi:hypothetical protein
MSQAGKTQILIYASGTANSIPSAANLTSGANGAELALNYYDGKLFYKDNTGTVQLLASKNATSAPGSNTQLIYNNSGSFAASSGMTWNGTTLAATALSGPLTGTVGATTPNTGYFTNLRLYGASSGYVGLQGASAAGSTTYTLPAADGVAGYALVTNGSGTLSWSTVGGTPGGATTQVQYNNAGVFGGSAGFTYNTATSTLTAPNIVNSNGISINSATVSSNVTIASGNNGFSVGPMIVASGVTVTVSSGQQWVVI